MGRPRRTVRQKNEAKRANAANMQFLGETQNGAVLDPDRKKIKHESSTASPSFIGGTRESELQKNASQTSEFQNIRNDPMPLNLCVATRTVQEETPSCSYATSVLVTDAHVGNSLAASMQSSYPVVSLTPISEDLETIPEMTPVTGNNDAAASCSRQLTVKESALIDPELPIVTTTERNIKNTIDPEETQSKMAKFQIEVESLQKMNDKLREENAKLRTLNLKYQEAALAKTVEVKFTEVPGYPDANWLLGVSQNSKDSDYLFVKELLLRLFPDGIGNATVSGRVSNNPSGRALGASVQLMSRTVNQMDPEKVAYIKDRLYERRRMLMDPVGTAVQLSKNCTKYISMAISNNPSLRRQRTP